MLIFLLFIRERLTYMLMKSISLEEFNSTLQTSTYGQQYLDLIQSIRKQGRECKRKEGYHIHHVHPRALGGTDGEVISLTLYEHCLAHILLAKAIPCYETLMPITFLSHTLYSSLEDTQRIVLEEAYGWSEELKKVKKRVGERFIERCYRLFVYACAKCDDHQMVRLDRCFREECLSKMDISYTSYEKARQALVKANIFKAQKYKGVYRINEAIAWKGTARERKRLFEDGLIAKITIEAVPSSEAKPLE